MVKFSRTFLVFTALVSLVNCAIGELLPKGANNQSLVELTTFSCATGASADGDLDCTINYPEVTSNYDHVTIRALSGTTAPNADCTDGTAIWTFTSFTDGVQTYETGAILGEPFSLRACIYDTSSGLTSSQTASGVQARDTTNPNALDGFSCATGITSDGDIDCTVNYPANSSDYDHVDIRRVSGPGAPNADCASDGVVVASKKTPFLDAIFTDATGSVTGESFSYRTCAYDTSNNLTTSHTDAANWALDTQDPPSMTSLSAATSATCEKVDLTMNFPGDTSDYWVVRIYRDTGGSPACGDPKLQYTTQDYTDRTIANTGAAPGSIFYFYRLCVYDTNGNISSHVSTAFSQSTCL